MSLRHRWGALQVCSPVPFGVVICPQPEAAQCHNLLLPPPPIFKQSGLESNPGEVKLGAKSDFCA